MDLSHQEKARVGRRMGALAVIVVGVCAAVALLMGSQLRPERSELLVKPVHKAQLKLKMSDENLLKGALKSQRKESHKECVEMCASDKCRAACGGSKAPAASQAKKGKLGLNKGDEKLLQDAKKQQKLEFLKACVRHCNGDAKCKDKCSAPKKAAPKVAKGALKLPGSDLKLLADAEKRQHHENQEHKAMMKHDLAALGHHQGDMSDDVNHVPAMDGDGDWAPGMRSAAMKQLSEEREQARHTARVAEETDANDSWSS
uniref:Uncharacterized protein n=1 Tax=Hemiselmis andersenii TaxID=464988 RepID=A0A7S0Y288_HEMAN|eukprot:CAMPEP_0114139042 /NCGR_PEP_ID=MMETSP0043_2-20121206/16647_1 /TAXON_ID=464988 /ORGANISM="Hemiselmis andersenii, Strain CCMP644" /LENGTH=257 /DNA_ID=CAMNT_0001233057 /DNA_START=10 /DNA_END=783 /DNA_ORIENTATION=-